MRTAPRDIFVNQTMQQLDGLYSVALLIAGSVAEAEHLVGVTYRRAHRVESYIRETELKVWLYRILIDTFLTCDASGDRRREHELEDVEDLYLYRRLVGGTGETAGPEADEKILRTLSESDVKRAIGSLPEQFRIPVLLGYVEHLSYHEMAEILGVPVATVVRRLHRGRRVLQKALFDLSSVGPASTGNA